MKVLLCLCAWIAAATAHGIISYPVAPITYHSSYIPTVTTFARPLGVAYPGIYPVSVGPTFSYNLIPNNVFFTGGVVPIVPLVPADGKGKDKKKPGDKTDKDKKEETTEEPKKEDGEKEGGTEDLAH